MYKLSNLIVGLICSLGLADSARILCVFPFPSISHQSVYRALTDELIQSGHELVIITADPGYAKGNQTNVKEIDIHDATYIMWKTEMVDYFRNAVENHNSVNLQDFVETLHRLFVRQFKTAEFQKIIKEEDDKFDLLLLEASSYSSLALTHLIKAPVVLINPGTAFNYNGMGIQGQEFLYPTHFRQSFVNVSAWEKFSDVYNVKRFQYFLDNFKETQHEWFTSIIGYDVTEEELQKKIDLSLLNTFPLWEGIRPTPQNVIHLGGMHTKSGEELPQNLQEIFNSTTNGVIYVNVGDLWESNLLSPEKLQIMVNVLSQLPYDVLWKWNGDLPGKGQNIVTSKWFPQADLLRNPKTKLFITEGGLQSTDEAIAAGVPLIGIPFLHNQFFNAENYVRHKIGLKLDFTSLTEEELKTAISKVITDKGYHDNVFEVRTLLRDKRTNSLLLAASWIEYILRHKGAKHLQPPSFNTHWTTHFDLELLLITIFFFIMCIFVSVVLCVYLYRQAWSSYRSYNHRKMMDGLHFLR